jgi:nuclear factor 4
MEKESKPEQSEVKVSERSIVEKCSEPCLICGVPTTMLHLQVNACRACAAFFRRSVHKHKSYRCQKNKGNCDITAKTIGKPLCRYCRYKKCLQIGMKINKTKEEEFVEDPKPSAPAPSPFQKFDNSDKYDVDFGKLFQTINLIFEARHPPLLDTVQNHTKDFCKILGNFIEQTKPQGDLNGVEKINDTLRYKFLESHFIKIAQLLNQFKPFSALEIGDKLLLYKRFWQLFFTLERSFQTCQKFGNNIEDKRLIIDSYHVVDLNFTKKIEGQQYGTDVFLLPFIDKVKHVLIPFKKTNITLFEFSYMCQIALWSCYDILGLKETTLKIAEEMINKTANDMHEYFIQELRMPYYATRQSQLFKIVHYSEFIFNNINQMRLAKGIFNFGNYATATDNFEQMYYNFINKQ